MQPDGLIDELAAFLAAPARSGVYLTKPELLALARASEASLRVNERRRMLADVLRSAQGADDLLAMLDRLAAFCRQSADACDALARAYPTAAPALAPWSDKARHTLARLDDVQAELRRAT